MLPAEPVRSVRREEVTERRTPTVASSVAPLFGGPFLMFARPLFLRGPEPLLRLKLLDAIFVFVGLAILIVAYSVHQQVIIKRLRRQLAEKQDHSQVLRTLAMIDPLTGLCNRRAGEQRLESEVSRASRSGHPLSVLLFDLNKFKHINDTHGHQAGDLVLREFATLLHSAIRGSDLAVRMGGDEFLLILPNCRPEQLQHVLGRLNPITLDWQGTPIVVTYSAGWKEYEAGQRPEDLLSAADAALYATKRSHQEHP